MIVVGPSGGTGTVHDGGAGHPERPARIDAVMAGVGDVARQLGSDLELVAPVAADGAALARVHSPAYLTRLEAFCRSGGGHLDPDTFANPDSWQAALLSAGAGLQAIDLLRERGRGVAFVATRPPGHHALGDRAMGFCLVNNVAVAAAALAASGERVLVVDWDVHHGNGTQAAFWDDPSVLYVSTHQYPFYPGTGAAGEVGGGGAPGLTVNVPVPAGATGDVLRRALDEVAAPVIRGVRAELGPGLGGLRRPPGRSAGRAGPLERGLHRAGPDRGRLCAGARASGAVLGGGLRPGGPALLGPVHLGRPGRDARPGWARVG